ncbi:MAG: hypothetical protein HZB59_09895 [Ignavibacteriales bacterium]|nr:hypothetical protein [Ignavibacteriales bacterium]
MNAHNHIAPLLHKPCPERSRSLSGRAEGSVRSALSLLAKKFWFPLTSPQDCIHKPVVCGERRSGNIHAIPFYGSVMYVAYSLLLSPKILFHDP